MTSLSSACQLAASCIQKAQTKYKKIYDHNARESTLRVGDWVLVHFPQDKLGHWRKLSRPWHGPYRVVDKSDPDVTCTKVYYPQDGTIRVHQSRISCCPAQFPAGFYWYGGPGRPPKWVERLLESGRTSGLPLNNDDLSRVSGDACPSSCDSGDPPVPSTNTPDHVADSGDSPVPSRDDADRVLEQTFH